MNKQEAIEKINELKMIVTRLGRSEKKSSFLVDDAIVVRLQDVIGIVDQIDEPEKTVIPQFVADIIEEYKDRNAPIIDIFTEKKFNEKYNWWLATSLNAYDRTARAWLDGYEVEKEKVYTAKLKIIVNGDNNYLNKHSDSERFTLSNLYTASGAYQTSFTRSELEELNVWDNPAFEIDEVE